MPQLLPLISPKARRVIKGTTDSEHFREAGLSFEGNSSFETQTDLEPLHSLVALFLTYLDPDGDWTGSYDSDAVAAALAKAVGTMVRLCAPPGGWPSSRGAAAATREGLSTHITLNLAICFGAKDFYALRFAYPEYEDPPSLYWSTQSGATLDRRYQGHPDSPDAAGGQLPREQHEQHVVVASEPMTKGEDHAWHLLKNGE